MAFYVFASVLFLVSANRRPVPVAVAWLVVTLWAATVFRPFVINHAEPLWFAALLFATMFVGSVVSAWVRGKLPGATALAVYLLGMVTVVVVLRAQIHPHPLGIVPGIARWTTEAATLVGAYVVFGVAVLLRRLQVPRLFLWLGAVSYSLYLVHPLVYGSVPQIRHRPVWTLTMWLAITLGISGLTYRLVQRPSHELGRRLGRARSARAPQEPAAPEPELAAHAAP